MKTQLTYSQNKYINNHHSMHKRKMLMQQEFKKQETREKNNEIRPARAISFGGSITSKAINGLINNNNKFSNFVNGTIKFVNENEAAYNSIYSLIVAGMIKPIVVLCMPGSEEKDKQIVATKNFLQAFLGSFLSLTIGGGFIKKAMDTIKNNRNLIETVDEKNNIIVHKPDSEEVLKIAKDTLQKEHSSFGYKLKTASQNTQKVEGFDKIKTFAKTFFEKRKYTPTIDEITQKAEELVFNFKKNHLKIYQKNPEFVAQLKNGAKNLKSGTTLLEAFESFWKNSSGALTSIAKAKISTILLPGVMAYLFAKKNLEKEMAKKELERKEKAKETTLINSNTFKNQQAEFQQMLNKNNPKINFKGNVLNSSIDSLAKGIEHLGLSTGGTKLTKALAATKKPSARMADIESIAITTYWLQNTTRSKKIELSQKLGLNIHSALVTIVSSSVAFIIDWALDGLIKNAKTAHTNKLNSIVETIRQDNSLSLSNPQANLGEYSAPVKMAIKDACLDVLKSPNQDEALDTALKNLKRTKVIQDAIESGAQGIDKNLLRKVVEALSKTEPINDAIIKQCGNMIDAKKVSETLSKINLLDNKEVAKAIEELSSKYGKKLSKFKSLTIFTLVVRFLVPVLMVPVSGKIKRKVVEFAERKDKNKACAKQ